MTRLADAGKLRAPATLRAEAERLLKDVKSQRFVEDFLGQWLRLRQIAMNDADKEDAILIAITRDGTIYLGSNKVGADQLTTQVREKLEKKTGDKRVYVKADAHSKYGDVVEVVDNVRSAGVDELGLLTEQRRPTNPGEENKKNPAAPATPPAP